MSKSAKVVLGALYSAIGALAAAFVAELFIPPAHFRLAVPERSVVPNR